ncbi:MAG: cryptochrome/photolyase family protein [Sheuella sp.]|nr:cryptochrome/photolyase family protein [Sheuella sp.]
MKTIRLILGDQLNPEHSWFTEVNPDTIYTLMEIRQETDYVLHHAQKIIGIFAGMRHLAQTLLARGHRVHYFEIDSKDNSHVLTKNLDFLIDRYEATRFDYQEPDEYRLDQQLKEFSSTLKIQSAMVSSEHFYTVREECEKIFTDQKQWLMERFYRLMRTKHQILMQDAKKPLGDQWNFDQENRKPWAGNPAEPADTRVTHDHRLLWDKIVHAGVKSFGDPCATQFRWPLNRQEALEHLDVFIQNILPEFGNFQDAMSTKGWRLFHSLISFALNTKMLTPREVVTQAEQAYLRDEVTLATAEGFIRQIIGWREYIRGMYWAHMPGYDDHNFFEHNRPLPEWFWTGQTKMNCMSHAIGQSLEHAYAHHIQRLMIIGNFSLLAGLDPQALHRWYLGIYIDAFEWVELPNTVGMSQYADGGLLATKPYVSSAAYIDRMSDYCKGCHYNKKLREGDKACPFNALYWDFFDRNREKLSKNFRLGMVYRNLQKMDDAAQLSFRKQAVKIHSDLDSL